MEVLPEHVCVTIISRPVSFLLDMLIQEVKESLTSLQSPLLAPTCQDQGEPITGLDTNITPGVLKWPELGLCIWGTRLRQLDQKPMTYPETYPAERTNK